MERDKLIIILRAQQHRERQRDRKVGARKRAREKMFCYFTTDCQLNGGDPTMTAEEGAAGEVS